MAIFVSLIKVVSSIAREDKLLLIKNCLSEKQCYFITIFVLFPLHTHYCVWMLICILRPFCPCNGTFVPVCILQCYKETHSTPISIECDTSLSKVPIYKQKNSPLSIRKRYVVLHYAKRILIRKLDESIARKNAPLLLKNTQTYLGIKHGSAFMLAWENARKFEAIMIIHQN